MFEMTPVGYVASGRGDVEDDYWGGVEARITLTEAVGADALDGIEEFSPMRNHILPRGFVENGAEVYTET